MDIAGLVHLVIYLIGICCILGLLIYIVNISPVPEPFKGWIRFAVIFFAVVILIFVILGVIGVAPRLHATANQSSFLTAVHLPATPSLLRQE